MVVNWIIRTHCNPTSLYIPNYTPNVLLSNEKGRYTITSRYINAEPKQWTVIVATLNVVA